jgi:hypothetical protein
MVAQPGVSRRAIRQKRDFRVRRIMEPLKTRMKDERGEEKILRTYHKKNFTAENAEHAEVSGAATTASFSMLCDLCGSFFYVL